MDAKTVQKRRQQSMENEVMMDVLITFFHRNIIRGFLISGKRSAADVYRLLQAVKDSPSKVSDFLKVLDGTHEVKVIEEHLIDLSSPCQPPLEGIRLLFHRGEGVVKLERRGDVLYLDGKPLHLFFSEEQKSGGMPVGHSLRMELKKRGNNVSAKVLDHLVACPELWPESWKKDAQGNTVYVFFWDDVFRYLSGGDLCVRCGYWKDGRVFSGYRYLDVSWGSNSPAASSAS